MFISKLTVTWNGKKTNYAAEQLANMSKRRLRELISGEYVALPETRNFSLKTGGVADVYAPHVGKNTFKLLVDRPVFGLGYQAPTHSGIKIKPQTYNPESSRYIR